MANLITNGDFTNWPDGVLEAPGWERGRYSSGSWNRTSSPYVSAPYASGMLGQPNSFQQSSIPTVNGVAYILTFQAQGGLGSNGVLRIAINGIEYTRNVIYNIWQLYTINFTANTNFTTIEFFTNASGDVNSVVIDDVTLIQDPICYIGSTKAYVRNFKTGKKYYLSVDQIVSDEYQVYSTEKNEFIPIKYNITTGEFSNFYRIRKDLFGQDKPNEDLYITSGHRIMYNGEKIKVRDIDGAEKVKTKAKMLYSICVEDNQPILINGIGVVAYGEQEWLNYARIKKLAWKDNKK